jgi:hypothetical protein
METTVDTTTREFNTDQLRNMAMAMGASSQDKENICEPIANSLPSIFKSLTEWILMDYENNYQTVMQLTRNLSFTSDGIEKGHLHHIDLGSAIYRTSANSLKFQIENNIPLDRNLHTKALAQEIANMNLNVDSVEDWASKLSLDISKGKD